MDKTALRKEMRGRMGQITAEQKRDESNLLCARVVADPQWVGAKTIAAFVPMKDEIDISRILEDAIDSGKTLLLPRIHANGLMEFCVIRDLRDDLQIGSFGFSEPRTPSVNLKETAIDLMLVPGVAFDSYLTRMGRGRGHYDKFFANAPTVTHRWGVCFDCQLTDGNLPTEPHDISMTRIITAYRQCPHRAEVAR